MPQIINTNIASLNAQRNLNVSQSSQATALERLSSGLRINSAKDDAAGLAIATRFEAQTRGLTIAIRNANDGISLAQTAEGALGSITDALQRVRELALQSANGTYSTEQRVALNEEAQQLIAEVQRTAEQTNFNGRNLLDGTFQTSFQVGANVAETIAVELEQTTADTLGVGGLGGITAVGTDNALSNGDLIINGVAIGPSSSTDDSASTDNAGASAIAKAAAINEVSDQTGVVATANTNVVAGSSMTAAALTGSVTINGVAITISTSAEATASRATVIQAINLYSDQTGVTAIDSGSDENGVQLVAEDGRNIELAFTTLTAAATGLGGAGTYETGFTLTTIGDTNEIVVTGGDGTGNGNIADAGLIAGTYTTGVAAVTSTAQTVGFDTDAATTAANAATVALADGDLVINGVSIGASNGIDDTASDGTASSSDKAASGIAIAAAINEVSDATGVTAEINETVVVGGTSSAFATAWAEGDVGTLHLNNIEITITLQADFDSSKVAAIDAINQVSGQTGVVASDNGVSITLTAVDGRNISVFLDNDLAAANTADSGSRAAGTFGESFGLDDAVDGIQEGDVTGGTGIVADEQAGTTYSTVTLKSASEIDLSGSTAGTTGVEDTGFKVGTFGGATAGQFIKDVDITTMDGANLALIAIDNALNSLSNARASLGALQNRFESTVTNLAVTRENLTAASSRITDADFAVETAALSKSQVLQQAGISILSQANALPQQVLQLLQ